MAAAADRRRVHLHCPRQSVGHLYWQRSSRLRTCARFPTETISTTGLFNATSAKTAADSANYVSREMGYQDLDDNGDWSYVAGYGPCWRRAPSRGGGRRIATATGRGLVRGADVGRRRIAGFGALPLWTWAFANNGWVVGAGTGRGVADLGLGALVAFVGGGGASVSPRVWAWDGSRRPPPGKYSRFRDIA